MGFFIFSEELQCLDVSFPRPKRGKFPVLIALGWRDILVLVSYSACSVR